jgi:hypothetical protein
VFTRQEASRIKEEFWTAFGKYMNPIESSEGVKVNWVNYHTRLKDVYFRMDTTSKSAAISISIEHRDAGIQELFFEQFLELKGMLELELGEKWTWKLHDSVDGKTITRIYKELQGASVLNKDHWPDLISFFKPRIIALDRFWENARYSFDDLR